MDTNAHWIEVVTFQVGSESPEAGATKAVLIKATESCNRLVLKRGRLLRRKIRYLVWVGKYRSTIDLTVR